MAWDPAENYFSSWGTDVGEEGRGSHGGEEGDGDEEFTM